VLKQLALSLSLVELVACSEPVELKGLGLLRFDEA